MVSLKVLQKKIFCVEKIYFLYYNTNMAKKRHKYKESIFVGNEYFEKCGISRQALRYHLKKGNIKEVGKFKGLNLYFQADADSLILDYWISNYKKFLKLLESAWELEKQKDPAIASLSRRGWKSKLMIDIFKYPNDQNLLPKVLSEFKNNLIKYVIFPSSLGMDYDYREGAEYLSEIYSELFEKFFNGIILRNDRFIMCRLSIDDFIKKDTLNKFQGKSHDEVMGEYEIRKHFKLGNYNSIEKYLEEKKPESKEDVKGFELYEKLKKYYEKLKNKAR